LQYVESSHAPYQRISLFHITTIFQKSISNFSTGMTADYVYIKFLR
jgi:hypothetical protein